jgi:hypothetical protein
MRQRRRADGGSPWSSGKARGEVTGEGSASRGDAAGRIGCAEGLTDADTDSDRVDGAADEHDDASLHDRSWKKKYMGAG